MNHTRLNTEMPLPSFVTVAVIAVLTCICINIKVDARALSDDPWPFWGRTVERVGYTDTIGPQTPTIDWFILISTFYEDNDLTSSCTMDSEARLFVGVRNGLVVVDTVTREIAWEDLRGNRVGQTPALWSGYVLWGYSREGTSFVCSDAATGSEIWLIDEPAVGYAVSAVVGSRGIAYFHNGETLLARRVSNGEEVWTTEVNDTMHASPTLARDEILLFHVWNDAFAADSNSGSVMWKFPTGRLLAGISPFQDGRFYVGSWDSNLYCIDVDTGEEIWRFDALKTINGAVAISPNGTIYCGTGGGETVANFFAVSSEGKEIWRYMPGADVQAAPVIGGDGTIYFSSGTAPDIGFAHALRPYGLELWKHRFPDRSIASPMLAPDGTLYFVCRNKNLYAFRDPHLRASITNLEVTTGTILDGGINEIAEPDGAYLHTRSGFGTQLSELHKTEIIINATVADSQPAIMRIQIESRTDQPAAKAIIQLRNWTTGRFETIRNYEVEAEEEFEWIQIPKGGNGEQVNPQRYIRPSGGIELRLKHIVFVPFLAFTFESFIDQIKIEVTG